MTTVKQRLKIRGEHAKQGKSVRCARCSDRIDHSFNIDKDGRPVHYSCATAPIVKGPEKWERK